MRCIIPCSYLNHALSDSEVSLMVFILKRLTACGVTPVSYMQKGETKSPYSEAYAIVRQVHVCVCVCVWTCVCVCVHM